MSIFLHLPGISGNVLDPSHKGWIDIVEAEFDINRKLTLKSSTRNDRENANAAISHIELTKLMDSSSPNIFLEACCGRGKTVQLALVKTGVGSGADTYMEYVLENCLVSKYEVQAMRYSNLRPVEIIQISFTRMTLKYTSYDNDGNALAPLAAGFDYSTNLKI